MSKDAPSAIVGVPRESFPGENRVALVPASVGSLTKAGLRVLIEAGAGSAAGFADSAYTGQGAQLASSRDELFSTADILLAIRAAGANPDAGQADVARLRDSQTLIAQCDPLGHPAAMQTLAGKRVTAFSLELVPRITRAQSMDVLSSMAMVAGYKAVLLAADTLPRMFPMMMTAAGTIAPAKVFIVGAGVAGLQAISAARRLGAVVQAYDVRPAVKEEVQSLGARFVELELKTGEGGSGGYAQQMDEEFYRRQRELMTAVVADSDVVVTTAAVPGKKAPILVTADMVRGMRPGSVIVDLAAEQGGNCELTTPNKTVVEHGVTILGPVNVPSTIPFHASQLFSKNISTFLLNLVKQGELTLNMEDEIVSGTLVTHGGEVVHPRVRELLGLGPLAVAGQLANLASGGRQPPGESASEPAG